jgi:glycosyltransferase involved in cell wall biosynthesis
MMEAYARRAPVVYVDPDAGASRTAEREVSERLWHVTMGRTLRGGRLRGVAAANRWLGLRRVLRSARARHGGPVILVSQQPNLLPTLAGLPADLKVYEVRDDYAGFALHTSAAARLQRAHRRMLRESDVVWAISRALVDDIRTVRPDVERTDVGVECDAFARAAADARADRGREGSAARPPCIGLVGNLNDRIDWELLESIARARPHWQLTLVGPVYHASAQTDAAVRRLREVANVRLPGPVGRDGLPAAVAALDVGLIPYRMTAANRRINPLKLYQYLAAGVPVVATPIPAVAEVEGAAALAEGPDAFVAAIEAALRTDDAGRAALRARARAFDWQAVADRQLEIASRRLGAGCPDIAAAKPRRRQVA